MGDIYIYIYIYIFVCVCVRMYYVIQKKLSDFRKKCYSWMNEFKQYFIGQNMIPEHWYISAID